jgi:hypothetical protein
MATTFKLENATKPPPRWYRITSRIINLITAGGVLTGTFTQLGMSEAVQTLVVGWLLLASPILATFLGNSQQYTETT